MLKGERQTSIVLSRITPDHKYRYQWVASKLIPSDTVLDACCGVGYGSYLLAQKGPREVVAYDNSKEAIDTARKHYSYPSLHYYLSDYKEFWLGDNRFSVITCFEAIEHVDKPELLLKILHDFLTKDGTLYISSPNETINPYSVEKYPFHTRHWSANQFEEMLNLSKFKIVEWYSQRDKRSKHMDNNPFGRTMIAVAKKL